MTRRVTLKLGFSGGTREVPVVLPDDEPRPWEWGERFTVVGVETPRADGPMKATGAARYTYDVDLPGMLHGAILRSPHPHARVRNVDLSAARRLAGVRAAIDRGGETVRFAGQEVAAVAAVSPRIAADALALIKVDYEPLPFVAEMEAALQPDAPASSRAAATRPIRESRATEMSRKGSNRRPRFTKRLTRRPCRPTSRSRLTARSRNGPAMS